MSRGRKRQKLAVSRGNLEGNRCRFYRKVMHLYAMSNTVPVFALVLMKSIFNALRLGEKSVQLKKNWQE